MGMATTTKAGDRLERMLRQQVIERGITDGRLLDAMRRVPRQSFFPDELQREAFADRATEIGHGQTISQPYVVALMTHRLDVRPQHRVLEISTGTGYQTCVLAGLAREVYTIERIKPLLDDAFERVLSLALKNVHFRFGDGFEGWPGQPLFDRVIFTAAPETFPEQLILSTLADGGICVLPVGGAYEQKLEVVTRTGNTLAREAIFAVTFVPMIAKTALR